MRRKRHRADNDWADNGAQEVKRSRRKLEDLLPPRFSATPPSADRPRVEGEQSRQHGQELDAFFGTLRPSIEEAPQEEDVEDPDNHEKQRSLRLNGRKAQPHIVDCLYGSETDHSFGLEDLWRPSQASRRSASQRDDPPKVSQPVPSKRQRSNRD